jgi:hypothetical protein
MKNEICLKTISFFDNDFCIDFVTFETDFSTNLYNELIMIGIVFYC